MSSFKFEPAPYSKRKIMRQRLIIFLVGFLMIVVVLGAVYCNYALQAILDSYESKVILAKSAIVSMERWPSSVINPIEVLRSYVMSVDGIDRAIGKEMGRIMWMQIIVFVAAFGLGGLITFCLCRVAHKAVCDLPMP